MTVKEIFDLRKQGKVEEAYEAIRPLYAAHKGKFTTLCMFWTASDVFKLRLEQGRVEEAEKIYKAMLQLLPSIVDDPEHKAAGFMHYAEGRLIKSSEKFRKRYFAIRDKKKVKEKTPPSTPPLAGAGSPEEDVVSLAGAGSPEEEGASLVEMIVPEREGINIPSNDNGSINPRDSCPTEKSETDSCDFRDFCVTSELNVGQQAVLDTVKSHPGLSVPRLSDETGIPSKSVERHIKVLIERGLIEHRGSKKTGGYFVVSEQNSNDATQ